MAGAKIFKPKNSATVKITARQLCFYLLLFAARLKLSNTTHIDSLGNTKYLTKNFISPWRQQHKSHM